MKEQKETKKKYATVEIRVRRVPQWLADKIRQDAEKNQWPVPVWVRMKLEEIYKDKDKK